MPNFLIKLSLPIIIKMFSVVASFGVIIILNNSLDSERYRLLNLALSYSPIMIGLFDFGINTLIYRHYTKIQDPKVLKSIWSTLLRTRLIFYSLGVILFLVWDRLDGFYIIKNFLGEIESTDYLTILILVFTSQYIITADLGFQAVTTAQNRLWTFSITDLVSKSSLLIIMLVFTYWWKGYDILMVYILGGIFASSVIFVIDSVINREWISYRFFNSKHITENLRPHLFFSFLVLISMFYSQYSKIILDQYVSSDDLNGYSNAFKVYQVALIIPSFAIPVISSKYFQEKDKIRSKVRDFVNKLNIRKIALYTTLSLTGIVVIMLLGQLALRIIQYRNSYESAYISLPILILVLIPQSMAMLFKNYLNILGKERDILIIQSASLFFTIGLLILMIPEFKVLGAGFAILIGSFLEVLLFTWKFRSSFRLRG